jgi:hypothetical protein
MEQNNNKKSETKDAIVGLGLFISGLRDIVSVILSFFK